MAHPDVLRLAVAQTEVSGEVPTAGVLAAAGARVRSRMAEAATAGARVVQFPEGTLSYPSKRLISRRSPEIGEADWAMGVDAVLVSSAPSPTLALLAQSDAIMNAPAGHAGLRRVGNSEVARSGICGSSNFSRVGQFQ